MRSPSLRPQRASGDAEEIRNRESISNLSVQRDELPIRRAAAREDTRFEEPEQSLEAINIRALTRNKQLSHYDVVSVIMRYPKLRRLRASSAGDEVDDDASYHFTFSLPPIQDVLSFAACSTR
ncbi:hypothetical protein PC118_g21248 [Phytophthora cactorum]|uniref:Uncharacterized protein n=1 Tax=Phytophthora cactorum TaxID=29920 RepID=A0A8T1F385_9STRA|nr:hypothetical protein PC118_g21248 [Phytophthora cactorum]